MTILIVGFMILIVVNEITLLCVWNTLEELQKNKKKKGK